MKELKSYKDIIGKFESLEKSARTSDDYSKLARKMLNDINEHQGYSKDISKKFKLWASELYTTAGDLIMDETGDQIKSWEYWQLSSKLKE